MKYWLIAVVFLVAGITTPVLAVEFNLGASLSSTNFHILDPQHAAFGGVASSSSSSFRLLTSIGDLAIGSSSMTSFAIRSGFLYFPTIVAPTLTAATAGDSQVALNWLAADALGGLAVGSYNVCTSSGTYTCQNVAGVTSYTKTSLTNDTLYTFKVQANDALGNVIAESNELSATPAGTTTPTSTPPPGSGGGGGSVPPQATGRITLGGYAYPRARVIILRDAIRVTESTADSGGRFSFEDKNVAPGTYKYSIYAIDSEGVRSSSFSILVSLAGNDQKAFNQLVLPPTISRAAYQLTKKDTLNVHGSAFPGSQIQADIVPSGQQVFGIADPQGRYSITYPLGTFTKGIYGISTKMIIAGGLESPFSTVLQFGVDVPFKKRTFDIPRCGLVEQPDLNCDGRVDIVDISILMFYYKRPLPVAAQFMDFNGDGEVDIIDFSILVFFWTG